MPPAKQAQETESSAFKNWINADVVKRISGSIQKAYPAFDHSSFKRVSAKLGPFELKARVHLIRDALIEHLPKSFPEVSRILLASLENSDLDGFELWPYSELIAHRGLEHPTIAYRALKKLTPRFTSEFAIRPFLNLYPDETLAFLQSCVDDSSVDVRRWVSEGTRSRLPWGARLPAFVKDPRPTLKIIESLKYDDELYVRKSVANHLNDVAKDNPDQVIKTLSRWKREAKNTAHAEKIEWITRHALRTLIKSGNSDAMKLIGVDGDAQIELGSLELARKHIRMNEKLEFRFEIASKSNQEQKLVIDYVIHHRKSNGSTSPKVFKLKTFALPARGKLSIAKQHSVKPITTRKYYSGMHGLEIQVNGRILARVDWKLSVE